MKKDVLSAHVAQGLSLAQIGELEGKHPSTVGYWVRKHGLKATNRELHAPRGGVGADTLRELVDEGLTTREIAERLELSQGTIRYWLRRHGLATARKREPSPANRERYTTRTCAAHGPSRFILEGRGYYRCTRCRADRVAARRRKVKQILVNEAGARCAVCGYDRSFGALEFHHLNAADKRFGLGSRGLTLGIATLREEARKCVLLCANCHVEVEAGITPLPLEFQRIKAA